MHDIQSYDLVRRMTDTLLSTAQVAARLDLDRRSVWSRIKAGTLSPTFQHPGTGAYLFDADYIESLAAAETKGANA